MHTSASLANGFGDFVPGNSYIYNVAENMSEQEANAKLVLGAIYILLGMGIIAMCVNLMQEKIITQVVLKLSRSMSGDDGTFFRFDYLFALLAW